MVIFCGKNISEEIEATTDCVIRFPELRKGG